VNKRGISFRMTIQLCEKAYKIFASKHINKLLTTYELSQNIQDVAPVHAQLRKTATQFA
jgi:hypothetical protein